MCEKDCETCKNNNNTDSIQKRRQIQVQHNSGGFLVTITSDYEIEDIDFISKKVVELVNILNKTNQ